MIAWPKKVIFRLLERAKLSMMKNSKEIVNFIANLYDLKISNINYEETEEFDLVQTLEKTLNL